MSVVINVAFSVTLSNLVLLDSLISLSESFLMMYRSGGVVEVLGGLLVLKCPESAIWQAELRPRGLLLGHYALCVVGWSRVRRERDLLEAPFITSSLRETHAASVVAPRW